MITFKQKIYRGENWVNIENFPEIDEFMRLGKVIRVDISERKSFLDDYKKIQSHPGIRNRIKQLRQDIQNGYVYGENKALNSNTHWIGEEKDLKKKHYMSKDIDNHNRLTYDVYRPVIITDPDGGEFLYVKVSLVFCTDHKYRDTRKTYSENN